MKGAWGAASVQLILPASLPEPLYCAAVQVTLAQSWCQLTSSSPWINSSPTALSPLPPIAALQIRLLSNPCMTGASLKIHHIQITLISFTVFIYFHWISTPTSFLLLFCCVCWIEEQISPCESTYFLIHVHVQNFPSATCFGKAVSIRNCFCFVSEKLEERMYLFGCFSAFFFQIAVSPSDLGGIPLAHNNEYSWGLTWGLQGESVQAARLLTAGRPAQTIPSPPILLSLLHAYSLPHSFLVTLAGHTSI